MYAPSAAASDAGCEARRRCGAIIEKSWWAVTVNYGTFINVILYSLIVAFAVFLLIRQVIVSRKRRPVPPATMECPQRLSAIPVLARRCAHCVSRLVSYSVRSELLRT
jgi:hypothetical protein